jgi:hypothetical protein
MKHVTGMASVSGVAFALSLGMVMGNAPLSWQSAGKPLRFTALAANLSNVGRTGAGSIEISIERWSTEAERNELMTQFVENGSDGLLRALRKMPRVGYIRTPNSLGYDLHLAYTPSSNEGGRRIVLATDRPISFWEAANRPRTIDYPFTVIELRLDRNDHGEGKLSLFTKVTYDEALKMVVLENYANEPVRLLSVKRVK